MKKRHLTEGQRHELFALLGANENTNGLIRQHFPKGTDFAAITPEQVQWVQDRLWRSPILFLSLLLSCNTQPAKERNKQNSTEMEKKNIGNLLALYPKPMTVVGAEVEGKVNWLVVGHTGIIGHDRILVSMSKSHYTNQGIRKSKKLSINLVSREMLPKADYVGSVSGTSVDKSEVFGFPTYSYIATGEIIGKCLNLDKQPGMCAKEPMTANGIVRLSKIEIYPKHLDEYMKYATEVGKVSLRTEPGVLTMYAVCEKENPCKVTILETYASREAYEKHIASEHFRKYKQGTLHMVKSLVLADQTPLNPENRINNFIQ